MSFLRLVIVFFFCLFIFVPRVFADIAIFRPAHEFCAPFEKVVYCDTRECRDLIRTYGYRQPDDFAKSIPEGFSSFVCYNPYLLPTFVIRFFYDLQNFILPLVFTLLFEIFILKHVVPLHFDNLFRISLINLISLFFFIRWVQFAASLGNKLFIYLSYEKLFLLIFLIITGEILVIVFEYSMYKRYLTYLSLSRLRRYTVLANVFSATFGTAFLWYLTQVFFT